jgi:uncharacterized membrane protein HdeD (DUF308 family)
MLLTSCRYLALVYAIVLAIVEAVLNSRREQWQYAPLWIIDYVIVAYLLAGFWLTRRGKYLPVLMSAYALSSGVMYIAFFMDFDPELPAAARGPTFLVALIGLALGGSAVGLVGTTVAWWRQERAIG